MNRTDSWMECRLRRIIRALAWTTASVCLSFSASHSFAETLPTEFQGRWMVYSDKSPNDKCDDAEGINVSSKRVDWNHESTCGKIGSVQLGKRSDNVIVNMTCVDEEGWKNGRPRPPRTFRDAQIWLFFKIEGKAFMTQTSIRDKTSDLFKKCD
jgi:hypothetical protein